jgi:Gram-negative porin
MAESRASWKKTVTMGIASFSLLIAASGARAAVEFKAENGWQVSFEGFVNGFAVYQLGSSPPANAAPDQLLTSRDVNTFRVRTGLLPGLFAFNVVAPKIDGLDLKARVGLYPQIQNANTRNAFGSQIDLREIFFTVDGGFGQVLVGRTLNLYQGKNILTDMTLFGTGAQGGASGGGTTLGRIGYGYVYPQFGAQIRYTTPDLSGLRIAVAATDPSQIVGPGVAATDTKAPGLEGELSYARKAGVTAIQAWVGGLYQRAWIPASATAGEQGKTATGWSAGAGVDFAGIGLLASGYGGQALGSFLLLDTDSLDAAGKERDGIGFIAQATYTLGGRTKLGVSYGQNQMDETAAERAARQAGGPSDVERRSSWSGGVYHDVNKNLKVVAEYTRASSKWFAGQDQSVDVVAVGGFFLW